MRPEALEVLRDLCQAVPVCIVAHVRSDIGEAVIKGSLEAQGLLGPQSSQLRAHHVLCCSTPQGKESMLRQLEPGLHIDGDATTVSRPGVGVSEPCRTWCPACGWGRAAGNDLR